MHMSSKCATLSSPLTSSGTQTDCTRRDSSTKQPKRPAKAERTSQSFEPHSREVPHLQPSFTQPFGIARFRIRAVDRLTEARVTEKKTPELRVRSSYVCAATKLFTNRFCQDQVKSHIQFP